MGQDGWDLEGWGRDVAAQVEGTIRILGRGRFPASTFLAGVGPGQPLPAGRDRGGEDELPNLRAHEHADHDVAEVVERRVAAARPEKVGVCFPGLFTQKKNLSYCDLHCSTSRLAGWL